MDHKGDKGHRAAPYAAAPAGTNVSSAARGWSDLTPVAGVPGSEARAEPPSLGFSSLSEQPEMAIAATSASSVARKGTGERLPARR